MQVKIIIADDHPIVREGLKRIINEQENYELVGEASNGEEVLEQCRTQDPDVLLLDITMPGPGFLQILDILVKKFPKLRILVLSINPENHYAVRAIKAGASGYLTKDKSPLELTKAIDFVFAGKKYISHELAEELALELSKSSDSASHNVLSDREYQILCMIGAGQRTGEIARKLSLSPKTVSTYRKRIMEKMDFKNTAEIVRYTLENGLEQ